VEQLQKDDIRARLEDLQKAASNRHNVTVDSLTAMYLADREAARGVDQYSSAITAVDYLTTTGAYTLMHTHSPKEYDHRSPINRF